MGYKKISKKFVGDSVGVSEKLKLYITYIILIIYIILNKKRV